MNLYPLQFDPLYKTAIWGGTNLERHGKKLTGAISESWEVAANASGMSVVSNGPLSGISLADISAHFGTALLGTKVPQSSITHFPLLIKYIDANDRLSVQVHPDDHSAAIDENGATGKNEMWYVLEAAPGAEVVHGFMPGTNKDTLLEALRTDRLETILSYQSVKAGDVLFIPAGTVHAIGAGIVLVEIQQNADITYRLYDYNRVDILGNKRELHVEKACELIKPEAHAMPLTDSQKYRYDGVGYRREVVTACSHFVVEQVHLCCGSSMCADGTRFHILVTISGAFTLKWQGGVMQISAGQTILIPAVIGTVELIGVASLLVVYLPETDAASSQNCPYEDAMIRNATHISTLNIYEGVIHAGATAV